MGGMITEEQRQEIIREERRKFAQKGGLTTFKKYGRAAYVEWSKKGNAVKKQKKNVGK